MLRNIFFTLLLFALALPSYAQESKEPKTVKESPKTVDAPVPPASPSKVEGLELPPDMSVGFDEGFISLTAKCSGPVKWLVVSAVKVKYQTIPQNNSIIISVPPAGGLVTVFAIGVVDGKLTEFARTNVNITAPLATGPEAGPKGVAPVVEGPLHVTFLIDMDTATPTMAQLLNSPTLRQGISAKGHFRVYDIKDKIVAGKKLTPFVTKVGGSAVMIVQRNDGVVISAVAIPNTEADILAVVNGTK